MVRSTPVLALAVMPLLTACFGEPAAPPPNPPPKGPVVQQPPQQAAPPPAKNKPPKVRSVRIEPARFTAQQDVRAVVDAVDPEGDVVDIDYRWFKNDSELLHRRGESLPAIEFDKGDELKLVAVVSDEEHTEEKEFGPVTVANAPPLFLTDTGSISKIDGFTVRATDPDDDPLTYKLTGQPEGMSIDASSGRLSYKGTETEPGGAYRVSIIAEDPDGGSVKWSFGIEITPGSAAAGAGGG